MGGNEQQHTPLGSVKTYREGLLRLQGTITFCAMAFLSAGLLVLYELLVINAEDQDFRDMLFDYRITRGGISYQHKHFANAHMCGCHSDPAVFPHNCSSTPAALRAAFGQEAPHCPPAIQLTCPDLLSQPCNNLRALLYPATGLNASTGAPQDCRTAGRVVLRARAGQGYGLQALWWGADNATAPQLWMTEDAYDAGQVQALVDAAVAHADPMFILPSRPLSASVSVDGQPVALAAAWQPGDGGDKWGDFGWPAALWPWPPSAPCSNTSKPAALWFEGEALLTFSPFEPNSSRPQPVFRFAAAVADGTAVPPVVVPQYMLASPRGARLAQPAPPSMQLQQAAGLQSGVDAAAAAATGGGLLLPDGYEGSVLLLALSSIELPVGLVAPLMGGGDGGCGGSWVLHVPGVVARYGTLVWEGSLQQLADLATQQQQQPAGEQHVAVSLHDVSEPRALALPRYAGEMYIYAALVLGGVWLFSAVPLVILFGVVVLNVQRNRGLPLFLYKYMRKYRGW